MTNSSASATPFEQAEGKRAGQRGFKDKKPVTLASVAEIKGFVGAFHIKPEVSRRSLAVGVARYSVPRPAPQMQRCGGLRPRKISPRAKKKPVTSSSMRRAAEVVPRYSVVVVWGR